MRKENYQNFRLYICFSYIFSFHFNFLIEQAVIFYRR